MGRDPRPSASSSADGGGGIGGVLSLAAPLLAALLLIGVLLAAPLSAEDSAPETIRASPLPGARADVAVLLMGGNDGGVLPVAAVAHPGEDGDDGPTVELWVEVDGSVLVPPAPSAAETTGDGADSPDGDLPDSDLPDSDLPDSDLPDSDLPDSDLPDSEALDIYAYILDGRAGDREELLGSLSRRVRLPTDTPAARDRLRNAGVRMVFPVPVPQSDRRVEAELDIRLLVRQRRTGHFALRLLRTTVPATADAPSVRWPDPSATGDGSRLGDWLRVYDGAAPSEERARALVERPDPPSAWPVLVAGRPHAITFRGPRELRSAQLFVGGDENNRLDITLEVAAAPAKDASGVERPGRASLLLPDVPTGAHLLELAPATRRKSARVRRSVLVLGSDWTFDTGSGPPPWTWVRRVAADPSAAEQRAEAEARFQEMADARRGSQRVAVLVDAYRRVLDRLASGDLDGAVDDLLRLESATLAQAERPAKARQWLRTAEERVSEALVEESPEALLPLIALHLGVHDALQAQGSTDVHALDLCWSRLESLSAAYAEAVDRPLAAGLAASALARVSLDVDRAGLPRAGRNLLDAAAALSAEDPDVLLLLGYWHERRGDCERAAAEFQRLVGIRPDHEEGRLRLATCLRRLGHEQPDRIDTALAHLRRLTQQARTPWVASLAKGELGQLLIDAGELDEAIAVLERASAEHPEIPRLRLQLALALDRAGQRQRLRETLAALESSPRSTGESPRLRYGDRPEPSADGGGRTELRRHAQARLPSLALGLRATAPSQAAPSKTGSSKTGFSNGGPSFGWHR